VQEEEVLVLPCSHLVVVVVVEVEVVQLEVEVVVDLMVYEELILYDYLHILYWKKWMAWENLHLLEGEGEALQVFPRTMGSHQRWTVVGHWQMVSLSPHCPSALHLCHKISSSLHFELS
jgi:hypothetical protein